MNCILFAVYLPSIKKKYVLEEIFSQIRLREKNAKVFIGVQYNSIPETEEILRKMKRNLNIEIRRVPENMNIDSDASAFIAALQMYSESSMEFNRCYFIHTKGITTGNDQLRNNLLTLLFNDDVIKEKFTGDGLNGSYGPFITFTDVEEDINKMRCMNRFTEYGFAYPYPFEFYYVHTFYVFKNHVLKEFMNKVSPEFFTTPISEYSDRYFMERDFPQIVNMHKGYRPSFSYFHGNYSTNFVVPTMDKYKEKYYKWLEDNDI